MVQLRPAYSGTKVFKRKGCGYPHSNGFVLTPPHLRIHLILSRSLHPTTATMHRVVVAGVMLSSIMSVVAQYSATYVPGANSLPKISEQGQQGTNACGTQSSDSSMCQNLYINSATDFCLWAPPGPLYQGVGEAERYVVSYCTKAGRGTRLIPPGTLKSVHFVQTPHYVQVSGTGEFSSMHINNNGGGGELDPHGQDGMGNPIGGLVFSNAFGNGLVQVHEWVRINVQTYIVRTVLWMRKHIAYELVWTAIWQRLIARISMMSLVATLTCPLGRTTWAFLNHVRDKMLISWVFIPTMVLFRHFSRLKPRKASPFLRRRSLRQLANARISRQLPWRIL